MLTGVAYSSLPCRRLYKRRVPSQRDEGANTQRRRPSSVEQNVHPNIPATPHAPVTPAPSLPGGDDHLALTPLKYKLGTSPGSDAGSLEQFALSSVPNSVPSYPLGLSQCHSPSFVPSGLAPSEQDSRMEKGSYAESTKSYPGLVHTPWVRNVPLEDNVAVGEEVLAFGEFMRPTPDEQKSSAKCCATVSAAARRLCPSATAKLIGSRAISCALPGSGTNIVVESFTGSVWELASAVQDAGAYACRVEPGLKSDPVLVCSAQGEQECHVYICSSERSHWRQLSQLLRPRLEAHGGAGRSVVAVVRTLLKQSNLDGPAKGGMTGTALALMVCTELASMESCEGERPADIAEELLKRVLLRFGNWDWKSRSVVLDASADDHIPIHSRFHSETDAASVCSPFSDVNLAAGCTKPKLVSAMFAFARGALKQWAEAEPSDMTRNSRGVTPLSSIVAHKELWDRSHAMRRRGVSVPSASAAPFSPGTSPEAAPPTYSEAMAQC